jgi:hypothetical protein
MTHHPTFPLTHSERELATQLLASGWSIASVASALQGMRRRSYGSCAA